MKQSGATDMLDLDYHIHTSLSPCSTQEMTIENILGREIERKAKSIALTDHCYSFEYSIKNVSRARLRIRETVQKMVEKGEADESLKVFFGVEAEILEYRYVSITPELAGEFDFVLVAPNHYHVLKPMIVDIRTPSALAINELYNFQAAVKNPTTDVVAHPFQLRPQEFGVTKAEMAEFSREMMGKIDWKELSEILETACRRGVGIELNPNFMRYGQTHLMDFYSLCLEKRVKLFIGSDAHALDDLDSIDLLAPVIEQLRVSNKNLWHPHEWEI
jgi:histidinol phosphatase-like PHP family hydrolase